MVLFPFHFFLCCRSVSVNGGCDRSGPGLHCTYCKRKKRKEKKKKEAASQKRCAYTQARFAIRFPLETRQKHFSDRVDRKATYNGHVKSMQK